MSYRKRIVKLLFSLQTSHHFLSFPNVEIQGGGTVRDFGSVVKPPDRCSFETGILARNGAITMITFQYDKQNRILDISQVL